MADISSIRISGQSYSIKTDIANSAQQAEKLSTSKTIAASGDVSWNISFDGSNNVTGNSTINNIPSAKAWSAVSAEVDNKIDSLRAYSTISVFTAAGAALTTNASAKNDKFGFSAYGPNISLTAAADRLGNPIIGISAKDTTYSTSDFIAASHLSNIETASGYATSWFTNSANTIGSAESGFSALSLISSNSSKWEEKSTPAYVSAGVAYIF